MLISFLGSPGSGKTTTAAMLFAMLKEQGTNCEFITEQARSYIAAKRLREGKPAPEAIELTDGDQCEIMTMQYDIDLAFRFSCRNYPTIIVSDSSPLNSLLYMSPECRMQDRDFSNRVVEQTDIFFICPALGLHSADANRVHTAEQSIEIDKKLVQTLTEVVPAFSRKAVFLRGEPTAKVNQAYRTILKAMETVC